MLLLSSRGHCTLLIEEKLFFTDSWKVYRTNRQERYYVCHEDIPNVQIIGEVATDQTP